MRLVLGLDPSQIELTERNAGGPYPYLEKVGSLRQAARAGEAIGIASTESASVTVTLDNCERRAATIIGRPLRASAEIYDEDDALLFSGFVASIVYGRSITLEIDDLLYEPLPLRTTGALGDFAEEAALPHRYGDLTSGRFPLIRLSDIAFFVADHPMAVADVFVDDQKTKSWEQALESDGAGNTWTEVHFAAPVPAEARISATGTGKRNPATGALIENPADIIEDLLRLAGRVEPWWDQLRAEAGEASIRLAGSIDSVVSIRAAIDAIAASCAAIWAPGMARLYPVGEPSGYIGLLDKNTISNLVVTANLDNTADVLRLYYDPDRASDKRQHYIEVTANPKIYGGIPAESFFDWLRSPSNAESVSKRVLPWRAGERYDVAFDCGDPTIAVGQWRRIVAHPEWPFDGEDPVVMILSLVFDPDTRTAQCTGQTLRSSPAAIVTAHSVALPTTLDAGVELAVAAGVGTFTFNDSNGKPVFDGRASLDGGQAKRTDAKGQVTFTAKSGPHLLAWQAPGKKAQTITVLF